MKRVDKAARAFSKLSFTNFNSNSFHLQLCYVLPFGLLGSQLIFQVGNHHFKASKPCTLRILEGRFVFHKGGEKFRVIQGTTANVGSTPEGLVAPSHPQRIPFSSLQQVERLICPSSQGDLPAINAPQIEPQGIHLFQQKAAAAKDSSLFMNLDSCPVFSQDRSKCRATSSNDKMECM
jgi:hypothetical protein